MKRKVAILAAVGILVLLAGMMLSVMLGAKELSIQQVFHGIFGFEGSLDDQLARDVRLPRMLLSVLVGGMLAIGGALMQGILRNPIAEPSVLGVTQGATLAVAVSSVSSLAGGAYGNFVMALAGAAVSGGLILLFSMHRASNQNFSRILLAGTAMSMFFLSMASVLALVGNRSQELAFWVAGGFRTSSWPAVAVLSFTGAAAMLVSVLLAGKINLLAMGDEMALAVGILPEKVKRQTIMIVVPICAVCVAVAGNIGFVGLFVPHIVRKIVGNDYRALIPLSFVFGAAVMVFADIAARMLMAPYELPVGLFCAFIGVPVFLMLVRKEKN